MINLAICGLGRWGRRLVESVQHVSSDVRFTHAVSRRPDRSAAFLSSNHLEATTDFAKILRNPQIDGVVLATPHSHHHDEIVMAAKAGKHVFVEKPITLTRTDAEDAVQAITRAKLALGIGHSRRFAPAYVEMMRRIHAGEIGEVLHLDGNSSGPSGYRLARDSWRANRHESPAGAMTARGIHALDAMIHIAGAVSSVFALSERRVIEADIDDTTSAALKFTGGATGALATFFATAEIWRVQAYGTKGWLDMQDDTTLVMRDLVGATSTFEFPPIDKERAALEAFGKAIDGRAVYPVAPAEAINTIAVLEAMVNSASCGTYIQVAV